MICEQRERTLADASDEAVRERIRAELDGSPDARSVRRTHCEVVAFVDAKARKMYTIGGNADSVCRQVERWAATGIEQMVFMFQIGRTTHEQIMRSIEIVGEKVIPRFEG